MRSGGAIPPPPQKGYLSDTCAIPYENKAKRVPYPPLRYYLERVLRDMGGGISHWAVLENTLKNKHKNKLLRLFLSSEVIFSL